MVGRGDGDDGRSGLFESEHGELKRQMIDMKSTREELGKPRAGQLESHAHGPVNG